MDETVDLVGGWVLFTLDVTLPGYELNLVGSVHRHGPTGTSSESSTRILTLPRLRAAFPMLAPAS